MSLIKKIDWLVLRGFLPPFMVTFFIAMFVLNMQFLWKYIDEIVGKGLEIHVIFEMLFYQCMGMVPLAFLLAVIVSAVMVMGNMAERYELVAMKSAGVSLFRIMRILFLFCLGLGITSFYFSDAIIPEAVLRFKTRLYDIRRQKPALSFNPGQFSYDFTSIVLYMKGKSADNKILKHIKLYDHTKYLGNSNQTNAAEGQVSMSLDKKFMILKLVNGERYEDIQVNSTGSKTAKWPFSRVKFKTYVSSLDLTQFNLNKSDEAIFKDHHSLQPTKKLLKNIDSLDKLIKLNSSKLRYYTDGQFHGTRTSVASITEDSLRAKKRKFLLKDTDFALAKSYKSSVVELLPLAEQKVVLQNARQLANNIKEYSKTTETDERNLLVDSAKYASVVHQKLSLAYACLLFLFIGAPMGAIIRKGGFGWPILIAIIYFTLFFVLNLLGEKMAHNLTLSPLVGNWLGCITLTPVAILLTYKAANDSKIFEPHRYKVVFHGFFYTFLKKNKKE